MYPCALVSACEILASGHYFMINENKATVLCLLSQLDVDCPTPVFVNQDRVAGPQTSSV
jgi:hypothetical protein